MSGNSGVLFATGFDYVADQVNGLPAGGWSAGTFNFLNATYKYGATGKGGYVWGTGRPRWYGDGSSYGEICLSFHYRPWGGVPTDNWIQFLTNSADTQQLIVNRLSDGSFQVLRGATVLGTTAAGLCSSTSTFYGLEIRVKSHNSTGEVEIVVDGVQALLLTGVDTENTAFSGISGFALTCPSDTAWVIDNIVFRDFSKKPTLYGTFQVLALMPTAAGDTTGYTPSAGSNYACVDEIPANGDTDYVETAAAAGTKDLYNLANHGITHGVVLAVQVHHPSSKKTDGALREFKAIIKHSATQADGPTKTLSGSYAYYGGALFHDCPGSSDWTLAQVDALQAGQEVVTAP